MLVRMKPLPANGSQQASWLSTATLLGATFFMGSSFVAGKVLLRAVPPLPLVGWRFLLAAIFTGALLAMRPAQRAQARQEFRELSWRDWAVVAMIGGLQTTAVMGLLFWAMQSISAGQAAILLFTNPIWVAALAPLALKEALSRRSILALALGFVGVILAIGSLGGQHHITGDLLGLLSALSWTLATLITKRVNLPIRGLHLNAWQMLIGSALLLFLATILGQNWPASLSLNDWLWFVWLAIPASAGSFGLWFLALQGSGAARASSFLFLTPLFTVILSHWTLGETLSASQAVGGILIGLSLYMMHATSSRLRRKEPLP